MSNQAETCLGKGIPGRGNPGAKMSWKAGVAGTQGRMGKRGLN